MAHDSLDKIFDSYEEDLQSWNQLFGSCQYSTIASTYEWALALLKHPEFGKQKFEALLGITYGETKTIEEFEQALYEDIIHWKNELLKETDDDWASEIISEISALENEQKRLSIADYYELYRSNSADLWSAYVNPLPDFEMETKLDTPLSGPIFNQMAQSDNFEIGIALAYTTFLYGTSPEEFSSFDT